MPKAGEGPVDAEGLVSSPFGAASQKCDATLLRVVVQWFAFVDDVNSEQL
jgi:hypothetical protein